MTGHPWWMSRQSSHIIGTRGQVRSVPSGLTCMQEAELHMKAQTSSLQINGDECRNPNHIYLCDPKITSSLSQQVYSLEEAAFRSGAQVSLLAFRGNYCPRRAPARSRGTACCHSCHIVGPIPAWACWDRCRLWTGLWHHGLFNWIRTRGLTVETL